LWEEERVERKNDVYQRIDAGPSMEQREAATGLKEQLVATEGRD